MDIYVLETNSWVIFGVLAFLTNLFITGGFAFAGFALPTERLLADSYYKIKKPSKLKSIYHFFRVDFFRKFLLATFWKNKAQRKKYFNGRADGIKNLETQSKKSEFGHLIPFLLISAVSVYFIFIGYVELGLLTFFINWIGNWYPIILQRHHRMRISRLLRS